jgi:hypothetical protein
MNIFLEKAIAFVSIVLFPMDGKIKEMHSQFVSGFLLLPLGYPHQERPYF